MIQVLNAERLQMKFKSGIYPGGEVWVRFEEASVSPLCFVFADIWSSDDAMKLFMVTDALKRMGAETIHLSMPYLPYARQDRVANVGESFSLKVFCQMINAMQYASVIVTDAHSDVSLALLDRVVNRTSEEVLRQHLPALTLERRLILVAPDAGAIKKTQKIADAYGLSYVRADKTRDTLTGELSGAVVYSDSVGPDSFLIVDDICDGGRTFLNLAVELRKFTKGQVNLYITHGIFSAGFKALSATFDHVYVANTRYETGDLPSNFHVLKELT